MMPRREPYRLPEPHFPTRGIGIVGILMVLVIAALTAVLN
ncbi:hypothetical protein SAMN05720354_103134 [Nitrosospira sp. Nsp1]|nr:hypothetical protein SAMN05720354_103134 [Nitrosospira sp. Nsp1]